MKLGKGSQVDLPPNLGFAMSLPKENKHVSKFQFSHL